MGGKTLEEEAEELGGGKGGGQLEKREWKTKKRVVREDRKGIQKESYYIYTV